MESIIKKFDVDYFCAPKVTENTDVFKGMVTALKEKDINVFVSVNDITSYSGGVMHPRAVNPNNRV